MKKSWFRKQLDVSTRGLGKKPRKGAFSALRLTELESRDVPSGNPAVALPIPRMVAIEDAAPLVINLSTYFTDPENDTLTFTVTQTNTAGLLDPVISGSNLTLTFAPNQYGYSYFRVTANDGTSSTTSAFEVLVREQDDLVNDTASAGSGAAVSINVLANDGTGDLIRQAEAGNLRVVQNDTGNAATSVTVSFPQGTPDLLIRAGSNRGDYSIQIGTDGFANDIPGGLAFSTVSENGRNNGEATGVDYATSNIDSDSGTNPASGYFLPNNRVGDGGEVNNNLAVAYFNYARGWLAAWIRNSTNANGSATALNDTIYTATPNGGFTLGAASLLEQGSGKTRITIPGVSSQTGGVILAMHAKNEDNFSLANANADGSWTVTVRDNGSNGTDPNAGNEQDPMAFVYIPKDMPNVVSGRILGDGTVQMASGIFTLTKTGTGTYLLSIPGQTSLTGALMLSPEGGFPSNADNVISYQPSGSGFEIQTRDITGSAASNDPVLEDVGATVPVASFAFIPFLNVPTLRITELKSSANVVGVSDLGATITLNPDGTVNYNPLTSSTIQALPPLGTATDTFRYTTTTLTGQTTTATVTVTVTAPLVWYVDDAFAGLNNNDPIIDANPIAQGNQSAVFGTTAFATIQDAINAAPPGQKILINSGTYGAVVIDRSVELIFQEGNSTVASIDDTVSTATIKINSGIILTLGGANTSTTIDSVITGAGGILKTGTGDLQLNGANTYTGTTTVSQGTLGSSVANALSENSATLLAAGTELRLNGTNQAVGSLTGTGNVVNSSATAATLTINTAADATYAGNLVQSGAGAISLVKAGAANLTLTGNNTIAGTTSVTAGTLTVGSATALGASDVNAAVSTGATLSLNGFNTTFATIAGPGTVQNGAAANILVTLNPTANATSTAVFLNGGSGTLSILKNGTASFELNGANGYTGTTTISQGTLLTNRATGVGSGAIVLGDTNTAANPVAFLSSVNNLTFANNFIVSALGTGTATIGTNTGITGATNTQFNGSITINRDLTFQAGSADRSTFAGQITGTGNVIINSTTAGSRVVFNRAANAANNFVGDVLITPGSVLQLGVGTLFANGNVPDRSNIRFASATSELRLTPSSTALEIEAVNSLVSDVPGAGLITKTTGTTAATLVVGTNNGSSTFSGTISTTTGTLNLVKTGTGTLTLGGAGNTYAGTTVVNGGTLLGNTTGSAYGTSDVTVDPAGTLGGTGSFTGSLTVNGRYAPGGLGTTTASNTGALTLGTGSVFTVDLNSTTAGSGYDQVTVSEVFGNLSGATLKVYASTNLVVGNTFTILNNQGNTNYAGFANGSTLRATNNPLITFSVSTTGGTGNDIVLTVTSVGTSPLLDETSGVVNFSALAGANNGLSLTNNGTTFTLTDTTGTIALSPAASAAGWVLVGPGSVSRPVAGVTGFVMNLGDGNNTVSAFNAGVASVTFLGSSSLAVGGVSSTGTVTFGDFSSLAVTGTVAGSNVTATMIDVINGTVSGKLVAPTGTVKLSAPLGLGTSADPIQTQAATLDLNGGAGGVNVTEDDGAAVTAVIAGGGGIGLTNLAGTFNVAPLSTTTGNISVTGVTGTVNVGAVTSTSGNVSLAENDGTLNVNGAITSTTGNVSLTSGDAIVLGTDINAGSGTITIAANTDGTGAEGFEQTAGTLTTTNAGTAALVIAVNTTGGGTGNASLSSATVTGRLEVNSNGGNVLFAGATPLTDQQRGLSNGGGGAGRYLIARDYSFIATGAGSVGTDARPIQTSVPTTNTIVVTAGSGGAYLTDWNNPVFLNGATATGAGNVRIVSANTGGHNLTVNGPVTTGSGNIYLAADDDLNINAPIGGAGFSGTVYLAANRDLGNTANARMNAGSSIVTTNNTATAVVIESNSNNGTAAGGITLNNITVGDGGTITASTKASSSSFGDIVALNANVLLNAGPTGKVILIAPQYPVATNAIGTAAAPINVTAGSVTASSVASTATNGSIFINATGAASFAATVGGTTGNGGSVNLSTTSGVLTISGPTTAANGGNLNLTSTGTGGGIAINAPLSASGNYVLNAGTNTATISNTLTIATGKSLTTTANGNTNVASGGTIAGTGTANNPITLLSGGTLSPNGTGVGTLSVSDVFGASGAKIRFDLNGPATSGTDYDLLASAGNVNLNGLAAEIFLGSNYNPVVGDKFTVLTTTGTITGSLASNTVVASNIPAVTFTASQTGGSLFLTVSKVVVNPTLDVVNGQLIYSGGGGGESNTLSVDYDTVTGKYTFSEQTEFIALGTGALAAGFSGSNTRAVTGPATGLVGISVSLGAGSDSLTLNNLITPLSVDGGGNVGDTALINGVLNANGAFALTGFNDITASTGAAVNATNVTFSALNGVGSASQAIVTKATSINAAAGAGGITIAEADGLDFTGNTTNAGAITVVNGSGTLNIAGATSTVGGVVSLSSGDAVTLSGDITTVSGSVTIAANTDGVGNQGYDQKGFGIVAGQTSTSDFNLTVNTPTGGTGDAVIGKGTFSNNVNVTSNGGSILWSNDAAYAPFTPSNTGLSNGGSYTDSLRGRYFNLTTGASGSVGTDARPLQIDNFGVDAAADTTPNLVATAGTGGIYVTDWNSAGGLDLTTGDLTAQGAGNIRVVAANAGGHNLWIRGNVRTGSGNIYLSADDNIDVGAGVVIGGTGFSGTVWMQANRDQATAGQVFSFDPTSSIVTSNTTNVSTATKTPTTQAVYLDISGDPGAPSNLRLSNITVGNGGRIVATATPNGFAAETGRVLSNRIPGEPILLLNAGATGTVEIGSNIDSGSSSPGGNSLDAIGISPGSYSPLNIVAGTFVGTASNFSRVTVSSSVATNFQLTGFQVTPNTGTTPDIGLETTTGALTVGSTLTNFNNGLINLTGAGGVVLNADVGSSKAGAISINGPLSGTGNIVSGTGTVTVLQGTDSTYGGSVSGTQALVKDGAGILTLASSSVNTFTGPTTITGGGLVVNGTLSKTSPVSVADATTLAGTGTIGNVTVSGSITAAGFGTTGTLNTRNLAFGTAGVRTITADINSGGLYDQLNVTGTVDLTGAFLNVNPSATVANGGGEKYVIINNDGNDAVTGNLTLAGTSTVLTEGAIFTVGTSKFQITYAGGIDNNDVMLTNLAPIVAPQVTGVGIVTGSVAIGGTTDNAGVVTAATVAAHGLSVGQNVTIAGVSEAGYNGTFTVTAVVDATHFRYTRSVIGPVLPGTGGTASRQTAPTPDLTGSKVTGLTVAFNTPVTIDTTGTPAFSITNGTVTLTNAPGGGLIATASGSTVTIAFDPAVVGVEFGSLSDGIWTLTTNKARIKNSAGVAGTGPSTATDIRRLFGDVNGDGNVEFGDYLQFSSTFNLSSADAGFLADFDFNGDGTVEFGDYLAFSARFNTSL